MPQSELLTPAQREQLLTLPSDPQEIARYYTLAAGDLELVARHRTETNRLGFASWPSVDTSAIGATDNALCPHRLFEWHREMDRFSHTRSLDQLFDLHYIGLIAMPPASRRHRSTSERCTLRRYRAQDRRSPCEAYLGLYRSERAARAILVSLRRRRVVNYPRASSIRDAPRSRPEVVQRALVKCQGARTDRGISVRRDEPPRPLDGTVGSAGR
jgi:hypothetical protein